MAARVILQAGHSAEFTPFRTGGGGAPGEAEWTARLVKAMSARLTAAGVNVALVGAWLNNGVTGSPPVEATRDADLFLSTHYDAAVYGAGKNTGAFADHAQGEPRAADSLRFIKLWEDRYFRPYPLGTGLPNTTARRNPNTALYYGYRATTAKTPSVLIEHGVGARGAGQDDWLLWDHLDHIAALNSDAILAYLGLAGTPEPPVEEEDMGIISELNGQVAALRAEVDGLKGLGTERDGQIADLRQEIAGKDSRIGALEHDVVAPLEQRVAEMEQQVREAVALAGKATAQRPVRIALQYPDGELGYVPEKG